MSRLQEIDKLTKTLISIPGNIALIDSLSLKIPLSECEIIDQRLTAEVCYFYPSLEAYEDELLPPKPILIYENGVTIRFSLCEIPIYNKDTDERVQTKFIVLTLSAKLLRERYFEGINSSNIRLIYERFIDFKIFYCDFEVFINSLASDVDICFNRYCESAQTFSDSLDVLANQTANKRKHLHLVRRDSNVGLNFNNRNHATPSLPFIKLYHKEFELLTKSVEFFNYYLQAYRFEIKNLTRIEVTIKNYKHKQRLEKYKILPNFKTLNELLEIPQYNLYQFIIFSFNSYIEKQQRIASPNLSPTEHIIYELLCNCISSGYDFNSLISVIDNFKGNTAETTAVSKSRMKTKITELLKLIEAKDMKLAKKAQHNKNISNYLEFLNN